MADYGMDRKTYIDAFIRVIDWTVVEKRFATAKAITGIQNVPALG